MEETNKSTNVFEITVYKNCTKALVQESLRSIQYLYTLDVLVLTCGGDVVIVVLLNGVCSKSSFGVNFV